MIIPKDKAAACLTMNGITPKGVFHLGAHDCEELGFYNSVGITNEQCVWIDAIPAKVDEAKRRGIPNVYQAVISDTDGATVKFNISSNVQSSSILEFGTHATDYNWIKYVGSFEAKTTTIDTFFSKNGLNPANYNVWNLDIQGAEYLALVGAEKCLQYADILYLEVNTKEVYVGCTQLPELDIFLEGKGFKRILTEMTDAGWGDAIYVRQSPAPVLAKVTNPLQVSLCIPTMNRWDFLQVNLPKYLENPYISEIMISDETGSDAQKIKETFKDPKIHVSVNESRLGAFLNKRKAVAMATNPFVCLMDSDNFAPLSYFEAWAKYLNGQQPDDHTIYAPYRTIPQANHAGFDYSALVGSVITPQTYKEIWHRVHISQTMYNTGNYILPKNLLLSTQTDPELEALGMTNGPADVMFQNYLMWKNSGMKLAVVPEMDYHHIVHDGSYWITNIHEINFSMYKSLYN